MTRNCIVLFIASTASFIKVRLIHASPEHCYCIADDAYASLCFFHRAIFVELLSYCLETVKKTQCHFPM